MIISKMFLGKRFFPDQKFADEYGIAGKTEIVSMGAHCVIFEICIEGTDEIFYRFEEDDKLFRPLGRAVLKPKSGFRQSIEPVTQEQALLRTNEAKLRLTENEQLIYYEKVSNEPIRSFDGFEFCGYDIYHDYEGDSAIYDCGYNFNKEIIEKLNGYGLFDNLEDAALCKKYISVEDTKEAGGTFTDYGIIFGVWRYKK